MNLLPPLLVSLFLNLLLLLSYLTPISRQPHLRPTRASSAAESGDLRWAGTAAFEAEAIAAIDCSGHGRAFLDGVTDGGGLPTCECNTCYGGGDCSRLLPDCAADADSGDPVFLEPYWRRHAASSAIVVSGWHRMSYQTTGDNFISLELERHIRLLHKAVGNAVTDGKYILFGTGSTQLFNALVYALSLDNNNNNNLTSSPARVVATVPYYPPYKIQTNLFDGREYEWGGLASEWVNASASSLKDFIEFVTSPSNPDGLLRRSVLSGSAVITDHAYYWPHYSPIPAPADEDVMLFTMSKISGHASSRFGWTVIKDEKIYERGARYMLFNTMGVSRDTQLRVLKLIKAVIEEVGGEDDIFEFGYRTMRERWSKLQKLVSASTRFSLQKRSPQFCSYFNKTRDPSPAFGWLKCEGEEEKDCFAVLKQGGILTRTGTIFEADSRYTRLSLIKTEDDIDLLLKRLEALVSKEEVAAAS